MFWKNKISELYRIMTPPHKYSTLVVVPK